ncbi:MAG: SAV_2336 N-terminal domain-related protein [Bryobacteraceae bacterium]
MNGLSQRVEALIDSRRKAETDDVVVELRDALWLAQFAHFAKEPDTPQPASPAVEKTSPQLPPPSLELSSTPETPPTPPAPAPPSEERQGLISGRQPSATGDMRKASRIRTPAATALPNALGIERALRPLRKRKPSARSCVLDEEATVRELAEAQTAGVDVCIPRFRPGTERWFELALIVDSGAEMLLWQRTIRDLRRLLGRQGAFSDVRGWTLVAAEDGKLQLENNAGSRHPIRALHHPNGRRLVLVLTQGTGPHWQDAAWQADLERLARNTPVGIVHFLPDRLWPYTRLGPARRDASSRLAGQPNHGLRLAACWEDCLDPGAKPVPFPVLTLDPELIGNWARMVMARKGGLSPCVLLGRTAGPAKSSDTEDWDPEQKVEQFRSIAPPTAFRLMCHYAAVPLTLPVMRIVREAMVPEASQTDMGAILASGLLRVAGPATDPEMTFFEFLPGVDDVLRESLRRGEERRTYSSVKDEIRRFLETQIGRQLPEDYSYVFDEEGEFELSSSAKAFVDVNRKTLERLGYHKKILSTKTRWPGLEVWLHQSSVDSTANMLFQILDRSLQSSGYKVGPITDRVDDRLILDVLTRPSGALVTVIAPFGSGRPINFSNQRRWDASYRELVACIDSTHDEPGVLVGVPEIPRPYLERTVLENALLYHLGLSSPVRVNLTGPPYSGKFMLMAAVARRSLTRKAYLGGIYWRAQATPESSQPGSRLFIEPGPAVELRNEDDAVWFDDPERGTAFEVDVLGRQEADHYFLACGGEAVRPSLDSLWKNGDGRLDKCAWLGVAIREFPQAAEMPPYTDFFEWLLQQLDVVAHENLRRLAVLAGQARLPEPLVAAMIPDDSVRESLYRQARSLCLLRSAEEGWWPLIEPVAEELLRHADKRELHLLVVNYYERLSGTAHWEDGYFRTHFVHHCVSANRTDALERFYNNIDYLLWMIQRDGWEHLAAELRIYGLKDLASRVERLAPGLNVTREELSKGLSLGRAEGRVYALDSLRVMLDRDGSQKHRTALEEFLWREGYTISENFVDADVLLTEDSSSPNIWIARNYGLLVVLVFDDALTGGYGSLFDAAVDITFDTDFDELRAKLLRLTLDRGRLFRIPELPTPYIVREELLRDAREALMESRRSLLLLGDPGVGKRTLAAAICRMPAIRRHFQGGIGWGIGNLNPEMGSTLTVIDEDFKGEWPDVRPVDRLLVISRKEINTEGMQVFYVTGFDSSQARLLIGLHSVHGDSHGAIVRFAGGNPGLICRACQTIRHFSWKSLQVDFRLLREGDGRGLRDLAARKLPPERRKQLQALLILGRNPPPTRELAEYVCSAPLHEDLFTLGALKWEGPGVRVLAHVEQAPDHMLKQLHQRVCDYYRHRWPEAFPARIPAWETYYWQYIRHHLSRAGDLETLPAELWPDERWWERTDWQETAALLAGLPPEDRPRVILWLAAAQPESAVQYILENGADIVDRPGLFQKLQSAWLPRLTGPEREPQPEGRAAIGRALGRLGLDNRKGVGLTPDGVPDIDWVAIPGGEFVYQADERRLIEPFFIARYPVTNAQFQAFLEAEDGYRQDRWWRELDQPDRTPRLPKWTESNHPRERVSWQEAMAFCAWLGYKLARDVRLPTEWQWERAAQGADGGGYPWGAKYIPGYANIDETHAKEGPHYLQRTSAVGIYPEGASPHGVLDLCGNVWEWCLNEYENPNCTQPGGRESRVLRGGSWGLNSEYARARDRNIDHPTDRIAGVGFRVVYSSPNR